jgi:hypothetical protein
MLSIQSTILISPSVAEKAKGSNALEELGG